jgi:hypothetical protein
VPIPIRFRLTSFSSGIRNADARLSVTRLSGTSEVPVALDPRLGNRFVYVSLDRAYWYAMPTHKLAKGTYRFRIDLLDGTARSFDLTLR